MDDIGRRDASFGIDGERPIRGQSERPPIRQSTGAGKRRQRSGGASADRFRDRNDTNGRSPVSAGAVLARIAGFQRRGRRKRLSSHRRRLSSCPTGRRRATSTGPARAGTWRPRRSAYTSAADPARLSSQQVAGEGELLDVASTLREERYSKCLCGEREGDGTGGFGRDRAAESNPVSGPALSFGRRSVNCRTRISVGDSSRVSDGAGDERSGSGSGSGHGRCLAKDRGAFPGERYETEYRRSRAGAQGCGGGKAGCRRKACRRRKTGQQTGAFNSGQ